MPQKPFCKQTIYSKVNETMLVEYSQWLYDIENVDWKRLGLLLSKMQSVFVGVAAKLLAAAFATFTKKTQQK